MQMPAPRQIAEPRFDAPPRFAMLERRLAGQALDAWLANGGRAVAGFADHSVMINDSDGGARIENIGAAVAAAFDLAAGQSLNGRAGLAGEMRAAIDLLDLHGAPVPFEASLNEPAGACVLVRGIALPLRAARAGDDRVQIVVNWREVLNRVATARLRREIAAVLRFLPQESAGSGAFSHTNAINLWQSNTLALAPQQGIDA